MRLGLGTVQFGLDYGVSNRGGQTPEQEAERILEAARRAGVDVLDTAPGYGASESVLGRLLRPGDRFRVVTKVPRLAEGAAAPARAEALRAGLRASLERLGLERVHGLLFHHAGDLLGPGGDAVYRAAADLAAEGLAEKVGVSVYAPEEALDAVRRFGVGLVQAPLNALDRRMVDSGALEACARAGVEVHARSVFLQGLLLMDDADLDRWFEPARPALAAFRRAADAAGMTRAEAAMACVKGLEAVHCIIVGVNTAGQFAENLRAYAAARPGDLDCASLALDRVDMVDPSRWRLTGSTVGVAA